MATYSNPQTYFYKSTLGWLKKERVKKIGAILSKNIRFVILTYLKIKNKLIGNEKNSTDLEFSSNSIIWITLYF